MSLANLLSENPFLELTANNRIRCSIQGHEMPPTVHAVTEYLRSKKLVKAREWYNYDYSEFAPLIVADKHNPKQLFCKVTGRTLNKIPDQVRKHVASQKYLRKREQYLQEQQARKAAGDVRRAKAAAHAEREKEDEDEEPEFWMPPEELEEEAEVAVAGTPAAAASALESDDDDEDLIGSGSEDEEDEEDDDEEDEDEDDEGQEQEQEQEQAGTAGSLKRTRTVGDNDSDDSDEDSYIIRKDRSTVSRGKAGKINASRDVRSVKQPKKEVPAAVKGKVAKDKGVKSSKRR